MKDDFRDSAVSGGKNKKKLTVRQRKAMKAILAGAPSVAAAMIKSGYSPASAYGHPEIVTKNPEIKNAMEKALRDQGIDEASIARTIKDGMSATDPKYEKADHYARHKFTVTSLELMGHLDNKPEAANVNVGVFVLPSEKSLEEWTKSHQ